MSATVSFGAMRWFRWGDLREHVEDYGGCPFPVDGRTFRDEALVDACLRFAGVGVESIESDFVDYEEIPDDAEFALRFGRCPTCGGDPLRHDMACDGVQATRPVSAAMRCPTPGCRGSGADIADLGPEDEEAVTIPCPGCGRRT